MKNHVITITSQTYENIFADQVREVGRVGVGGGRMVTRLLKFKTQNLSMPLSLSATKSVKRERNNLENRK